MSLACGGTRRAIPIITGAALTDAAYSLLAASGVLLASRASAEWLAYATPGFLLGAAAVAWAPSSVPPRTFVGMAAMNPATAAIWLSLSAIPAAYTQSLPELMMRPLPVALGTAAWFTTLALATSKLSVRFSAATTLRLQRAVAILLGLAGLACLTALVP